MPLVPSDHPADWQLLGYSALIDLYGLDCPPPRRLTAIASVHQRTTRRINGVDWLLLPRNARFKVPDHPIEHVGVALKHEDMDLRVLARLFDQDIAGELQGWIGANPAGIYTRRAWFLYEWMTGRQLDVAEPYAVRFVPVLDPNQYIVGRSTRSSRHKVDNNLPGVAGYCPLIRRTERLAPDRITDLAAAARQMVSAADPAILRRAVGFMLLNESKGSFGIEGETPPRTRLERWGRLIADAKGMTLSIATLEALHRSLFDEPHAYTTYGLRTTGGFVGRHDRDQSPIPDHISARHQDLPDLMTDWLAAFDRMKRNRFDAVLTAAIIGFGFVFIHPFEDGNGRLHRFMIQKALADLGFNPDGVVLPVSAAILDDLVGYRAALEDFSIPALGGIEWEPTERGNIRVLNDTAYIYRYFDATRHAEYLLDRIEATIHHALPEELAYLHRFDDAKRRIADIIDLSDRLSSLFIQFCVQNQGRLSVAKRAAYFDALADDMIVRLEEAVAESGLSGPAATP